MNLSVLIGLTALIFGVSCKWIEIDNYGNQIDNNFADFPGAYRRSYKRSPCDCGDGSGKTGTWRMQNACSKGSGWKDCEGPGAVGLKCCLQNNVADFPGAFRRSYKRSPCDCGDGSGKTGTWRMQNACSKGSGWKDCEGPGAVGLKCCLQGNY